MTAPSGKVIWPFNLATIMAAAEVNVDLLFDLTV